MGKELMEELPDELFSNISATLAVAKPGETVVDAVAETLRNSDQMVAAIAGMNRFGRSGNTPNQLGFTANPAESTPQAPAPGAVSFNAGAHTPGTAEAEAGVTSAAMPSEAGAQRTGPPSLPAPTGNAPVVPIDPRERLAQLQRNFPDRTSAAEQAILQDIAENYHPLALGPDRPLSMEDQARVRMGMEVPAMGNQAAMAERVTPIGDNTEALPAITEPSAVNDQRANAAGPKTSEYTTDNLPAYEQEVTFQSLEQLRSETSRQNSLKPLTRYNFNGHIWVTDAHARPIFAGGELRPMPHGRAGKSLQTKIGNEGVHAATDVGFHLIGDQFGGPISRLNIVQGDALLNNSDYKKWENELRTHLDAGSKVRVRIQPLYNGADRRPSEFAVEYQIDGGGYKTMMFSNIPHLKNQSSQ